MIETGEILQTMRMIQEENFDIRTITLGINLLDCAEPEADRCADRVYDKICYTARNLVHTGEEIRQPFCHQTVRIIKELVSGHQRDA